MYLYSVAWSAAEEPCVRDAKNEHVLAKAEALCAAETEALCAPSAGRQLAPECPCLAATTWHSRLQNHTLRHPPQRSSLPSFLLQAWDEFAVGACDADVSPDAVVLDPAASGTRAATSALAALGVCDPSAVQQFAPECPCLVATTWHSRLQNHTLRHRPQRSSMPPLPHAWHDAAIVQPG